MNTITPRGQATVNDTGYFEDFSCSALSWSAIIGGALAAATVSLILLVLGSALGLSAVSPWHMTTLASFSVKTVIWVIVMQWIAAGVGGYLTGRLRTAWRGVHTDEVFFRDTVHGFLAWAAATLLVATLLSSAVSSVIGGGAQATAIVAAGAGHAAMQRGEQGGQEDGLGMMDYYADSLLRTNTTVSNNAAIYNNSSQNLHGETLRILAMGAKNGGVSDDDRAYLARLVASRTGVSQAEASKRVDSVIADWDAAREKMKQKAEEARKTAMHISIYLFLSLLIGAFIASAAAAAGGTHRDD